ncbi:MAG: phosphoribosyl 1,2-cyclic phosphodiesterase [Flavobacteriales bacterium]|jgi:phosphoribosyl 1,2-cyclic phosphodiesterase
MTGLRFASLGSGSSGNATIIADESSTLLIDCGFSFRELERRLSRLDLSFGDVSGILITHEHGDHAKGVATIARRFDTPIYMSRGTQLAAKFESLESIQTITAGQVFSCAGFSILPVTVPHDAREPLQFVVSKHDKKIGVLTDLGSVSEHVVEAFSGCDGLLLEANHDLELLARGPYPVSLQRRVSGAWGHLNNQQTANLISRIDIERLQELVVGHISLKNNCLDRVKAALADVTRKLPQVRYACQDQGIDWLSIS